MVGQCPSVSFSAGAQRSGRESIAPRINVDPLPGLTASGDDTHCMVSEHVNASPCQLAIRLEILSGRSNANNDT